MTAKYIYIYFFCSAACMFYITVMSDKELTKKRLLYRIVLSVFWWATLLYALSKEWAKIPDE